MDSPITRPGATRISNGNSPEFEFWRVRNPNPPQPNLLSADELFVDGVLLPLHLLSHRPPYPNPAPNPDPPDPAKIEADTEPEAGPRLDSAQPGGGLSPSKRWTDIFKKGEKKSTGTGTVKMKEEKEKKREKKNPTGSAGTELNINIWPFSRSRSAGNGGSRPRLVGAPTRKVSSAPCSRSNSAGESKSRKWPSSPGRPGVHVGRSSPIWQVRRSGGDKGIVKREATDNKSIGSNNLTGLGKVRVLNLNVNVPMCIGYRHHLGCRSDQNTTIGVVGATENGNPNGKTGNRGGGTNLFRIRSLFAKKVY